jgi:hypothetical protein
LREIRSSSKNSPPPKSGFKSPCWHDIVCQIERPTQYPGAPLINKWGRNLYSGVRFLKSDPNPAQVVLPMPIRAVRILGFYAKWKDEDRFGNRRGCASREWPKPRRRLGWPTA